jgi:hypothetical protein
MSWIKKIDEDTVEIKPGAHIMLSTEEIFKILKDRKKPLILQVKHNKQVEIQPSVSYFEIVEIISTNQ